MEKLIKEFIERVKDNLIKEYNIESSIIDKMFEDVNLPRFLMLNPSQTLHESIEIFVKTFYYLYENYYK